MDSKSPSFTDLLSQLPGVKARTEKNRIGTCPKCFNLLDRTRDTLHCRSCGFRKQAITSGVEFPPVAQLLQLPSFVLGSREHCFYCGEYPDSRDHIIPWSYLAVSETSGSKPGPRVYACLDCNFRLRDKFFSLMRDRFYAVAESLRRRFQKELRLPDWSPEEIASKGYSLRTLIVSRQNLRKLVERRLDWQDSAKSKTLWTELIAEVQERYPECQWIKQFVTINPYEARNIQKTVPPLR